MASMNMESILAKAKKCISSPKFQKVIEDNVDAKTTITSANNVTMAADKLIEIIKNEMGGLGAVTSELAQLEYDVPHKIGKNKYQIDISFSGDLHRESLAPDMYAGVDNIIALLNNGYNAHDRVYGIWHGKQIASLTNRQGLHFVNNAVQDFIRNYGNEYGVISIEIDSIYKKFGEGT